jgi:hypothetical protein
MVQATNAYQESFISKQECIQEVAKASDIIRLLCSSSTAARKCKDGTLQMEECLLSVTEYT